VHAGDVVAAGDLLLKLESMKMEHPVRALAAAVVESVLVRAGDVVNIGSPLVRLAAVAGAQVTVEDT
jgi:3-methylcrotonyl-CoA carboxylase alpha subunit